MTTQPVLGDEPLGVEFYVTSFLWVVAAGTLWLGVGWAALTGLLAAAGVRILFGYVSIQQELFVLVMVGVLASYARPAHRRLYAVVALPWLLSQFVGMEDIQLQVLGAVVVLILTALAYAIGHIVGRLREDRDRSNSALRQAEGSLVEQRSALARELHDNAVSDLTVIVMKAQQLKLTQEGENWASELESILDRANITIDHMGRIVTLLRDNEPISEHQDRVVPAISEELVKAKNELDASGIVTTVESTNGADSLGPRVQLALHRILREAVANVALPR
ncbi:sensor histidine kinase [Nesterenkonia salmonea]|nr:histidine kinase [Nesterenkonia salmonea]